MMVTELDSDQESGEIRSPLHGGTGDQDVDKSRAASGPAPAEQHFFPVPPEQQSGIDVFARHVSGLPFLYLEPLEGQLLNPPSSMQRDDVQVILRSQALLDAGIKQELEAPSERVGEGGGTEGRPYIQAKGGDSPVGNKGGGSKYRYRFPREIVTSPSGAALLFSPQSFSNSFQSGKVWDRQQAQEPPAEVSLPQPHTAAAEKQQRLSPTEVSNRVTVTRKGREGAASQTTAEQGPRQKDSTLPRNRSTTAVLDKSKKDPWTSRGREREREKERESEKVRERHDCSRGGETVQSQGGALPRKDHSGGHHGASRSDGRATPGEMASEKAEAQELDTDAAFEKKASELRKVLLRNLAQRDTRKSGGVPVPVVSKQSGPAPSLAPPQVLAGEDMQASGAVESSSVPTANSQQRAVVGGHSLSGAVEPSSVPTANSQQHAVVGGHSLSPLKRRRLSILHAAQTQGLSNQNAGSESKREAKKAPQKESVTFSSIQQQVAAAEISGEGSAQVSGASAAIKARLWTGTQRNAAAGLIDGDSASVATRTTLEDPVQSRPPNASAPTVTSSAAGRGESEVAATQAKQGQAVKRRDPSPAAKPRVPVPVFGQRGAKQLSNVAAGARAVSRSHDQGVVESVVMGAAHAAAAPLMPRVEVAPLPLAGQATLAERPAATAGGTLSASSEVKVWSSSKKAAPVLPPPQYPVRPAVAKQANGHPLPPPLYTRKGNSLVRAPAPSGQTAELRVSAQAMVTASLSTTHMSGLKGGVASFAQPVDSPGAPLHTRAQAAATPSPPFGQALGYKGGFNQPPLPSSLRASSNTPPPADLSQPTVSAQAPQTQTSLAPSLKPPPPVAASATAATPAEVLTRAKPVESERVAAVGQPAESGRQQSTGNASRQDAQRAAGQVLGADGSVVEAAATAPTAIAAVAASARPTGGLGTETAASSATTYRRNNANQLVAVRPRTPEADTSSLLQAARSSAGMSKEGIAEPVAGSDTSKLGAGSQGPGLMTGVALGRASPASSAGAAVQPKGMAEVYLRRTANQLVRKSAVVRARSFKAAVPGTPRKRSGPLAWNSAPVVQTKLGRALSLTSNPLGGGGSPRSPAFLPWKKPNIFSSSRKPPPAAAKLLLGTLRRHAAKKRGVEPLYTRSGDGFTLQRTGVRSVVGGASLTWSKLGKQQQKEAATEATLAVAAMDRARRDKATAVRKASTAIARDRAKRRAAKKLVKATKLVAAADGNTGGQSNQARLLSMPGRASAGAAGYVRVGVGNKLVRDPKCSVRALASERVRYSLHNARQRKSRRGKYCQFYTKYGKCNKPAGQCPYVHDPGKVAICTRFLRGRCNKPKCPLTHQINPERMPDCSYFQQGNEVCCGPCPEIGSGMCTNEECRYRHVHVNPKAPACDAFLRGFCASADECDKRHTYICPEFEETGKCLRGKECRLYHPIHKSSQPSRELQTEGPPLLPWRQEFPPNGKKGPAVLSRSRYFHGSPEDLEELAQGGIHASPALVSKKRKLGQEVAADLPDLGEEGILLEEAFAEELGGDHGHRLVVAQGGEPGESEEVQNLALTSKQQGQNGHPGSSVNEQVAPFSSGADTGEPARHSMPARPPQASLEMEAEKVEIGAEEEYAKEAWPFPVSPVLPSFLASLDLS